MTSAPNSDRHPKAHPLLNLLLFVGATFFSLAFAEALARIYLYQSLWTPELTQLAQARIEHPTRGWTGRPNATINLQTLDYITTTRTNSIGMNDGEYPYEKPDDVFRIVMIGDSFLFAREVERSLGLPALMEAALSHRRIEVINLGVVGYGTTQAYFTLVEEGLKFQPDLVLLQLFLFNDVRDNSKALNAEMWGHDNFLTWARPYAQWDEAEQRLHYEMPPREALRKHFSQDAERMQEALPWWRSSALAVLGMHVYRRLDATVQTPRYEPDKVLAAYLELPASQSERIQLWEEALETTKQQILAIRDAVDAAEARLIVFSIPSRMQVDPGYQAMVAREYPALKWDLDKPERAVQQLCDTHEVPMLDLRSDFAAAYQADGGPYYFQIEDHHWNAAGHALAAKRLLAFIEAFLPPKSIRQ